MAVVSANQYSLAARIQADRGSYNSSPTYRYRQVAGDVTLNPDYGSENFSNYTRFTESADYVNSVLGQGDPGIQAQPEPLGHVLMTYFGADTVSASPTASVGQHLFDASNTATVYSSWWKRVGKDAGAIVRQVHRDCRVGQLQLEGSTANKVVRVTPTVLSLDPGVIYTDDGDISPTLDLDTENPFIYTEGTGAFKFAGVGTLNATAAIQGQSQFNLTFNENLQPVFGDSISPFELFPGQSEITMAVTLVVDDRGLQQYNALVYGTTAPAVNAKPSSSVTATGAYDAFMTRGSAAANSYRALRIQVPGIRWQADAAISPNPDGGPVELALAGTARKLTATGDTYVARIIVNNDKTAAYTV